MEGMVDQVAMKGKEYVATRMNTNPVSVIRYDGV